MAGTKIFLGNVRFFEKKIKIWSIFFILTTLIFRAFPKYCKNPIYQKKISAPQAKFFKNMPKNGIFGHFLEEFVKKMRIFGTRSPLKLAPMVPFKKFEIGQPKMDL